MKSLLRGVLFFVCFGVLTFLGTFIVDHLFVTKADLAADRAANAAAYRARLQITPAESSAIMHASMHLHHTIHCMLSSLFISGAIVYRWKGAISTGLIAVVSYFLLVDGFIYDYALTHGYHLHKTTALSPAPAVIAAAQQRATRLFPQLGITNSALNREFLRRYRKYQSESPDYFNDPEWPTKLARESNDALSKP